MYRRWIDQWGDEIGFLSLSGYKEAGGYNRLIPTYWKESVPPEQNGVIFDVNGERMKAFEIFLRRIPKLSEMLDGPWRENIVDKRAIPIENTTSQAFKMLLHFLETDNFESNENIQDHLKDLLMLSHELRFHQISRPVVEYIQKIFNPENIISFYKTAIELESAAVPSHLLGLACITYVKQNLAAVSAKHKFRNMEAQMGHNLFIDLQEVGAFGDPPSPLEENETV